MATLDDDFGHIDPATVPPYNTGLKYGLIGGLISVIYALIGNLTGLTKPSGGMITLVVSGMIALAISIGVVVFAIRFHRDKELGGYITFGRAFLLAIMVTMISALIGVAFNYIYMNFIDPNYVATMMEEMEEMLSNFGLNEEQIEQAMADAESGFSPVKMLINSTIGSVVISLITAAIMKKNRS